MQPLSITANQKQYPSAKLEYIIWIESANFRYEEYPGGKLAP
jgi:hypothetical protein